MHFTKMSGSGNDFIVVDNRNGLIPDHAARSLSIGLSRQRLSVGADGIVLLSVPPDLPTGIAYKWRYVNADGSDGEMCGNGAMCAARFAVEQGIADVQHTFLTPAGTVNATVASDGHVTLEMVRPGSISGPMHLFAADRELTCWNVTVGVPHSVMFVDDADTYADAADFHLLGNAVRHHNDMAPAGTNLNVVSRIQSGHWRMRTYERGVEAETLACGTGAVASSLVIRHVMSEPWPMRIRVSGGRDLSVAESDTDAITLTGHAAIIFTGDLGPDALLDQDSSQNTRRNSAES